MPSNDDFPYNIRTVATDALARMITKLII
jgi:hypothetical protein